MKFFQSIGIETKVKKVSIGIASITLAIASFTIPLKSLIQMFFGFGLLCASPSALAAFTYNMTRGITEISRGIYSLHMTIFWICVIVGIVVFSVMFYAIIFHRKSRGAQVAHFHESTIVEIIWTLIPFAILIGMAIPASHMLIKMNDTQTDSELTIKITGYQWYWGYEYLGEGIQLLSRSTTSQEQIQNRDIKSPHYLLEVDKHLVVPIGKKIRFLTTANDVIHSWWVPALGIKKDAIPGFINEAWARLENPGLYRGQCAELCGANHGFMPIVVEAIAAEDFTQWLATQKAGNPPVQKNGNPPAVQQDSNHVTQKDVGGNLKTQPEGNSVSSQDQTQK